MTQPSRRQRSLLVGFLYMLGLSILLFWLPVVGPFVAGFVGGRAVGSPGRGLAAAILPAIIVAIGVVILSTLVLIPGVGLVAGGSLVIAAIVHSVPLILGALVGGATAR